MKGSVERYFDKENCYEEDQSFRFCMAGALLLVCVCRLFTKPVDDSENTLEIAYYDAGYGYELHRDGGAKSSRPSHPGVSVVLSKSSDVDPKDLLSAGPGGNSVDLFIHGTVFNSYAYMGEKMLKGYDCVLEPIDDVLESEDRRSRTVLRSVYGRLRAEIGQRALLQLQLGDGHDGAGIQRDEVRPVRGTRCPTRQTSF